MKAATFPKRKESRSHRRNDFKPNRSGKNSRARKGPGSSKTRNDVSYQRRRETTRPKVDAERSRGENKEERGKNEKSERTSKTEETVKDPALEQSADSLIMQVLGEDDADSDNPRSLSLIKLLSICDRSLLTDELREQAKDFIPEETVPEEEVYTSSTSIRTYNPTVLGPLDRYVSLKPFEEDVAEEDCYGPESTELLGKLRADLSTFPCLPSALLSGR